LKLIKGRLKTARVRKGLTLSDVETVTDGVVKVSSLSSYERGKATPSCEKVELLARLYEVPMSYLCFCPYLVGERPSAVSSELQGKKDSINHGEASKEIELTSQELEILRKILEKLERKDNPEAKNCLKLQCGEAPI